MQATTTLPQGLLDQTCTTAGPADDDRLAESGPRPDAGVRGSVAVMTLFAASFIVGMIFAVYGIGLAIRQGDAKRDAADAVAFSAASMYAHSMNEVALLNMAKLTVISVLGTAIAAESVGLAAASAYVTAQLAVLNLAYLPQIPILVQFGIELGTWLGTNGPRLERLLRAMEAAQEALRTQTFENANLRVKLTARRFPTVMNGFITPNRDLPLARERPQIPCQRIWATSAVPQQLLVMFRRFMPDVGGIGLGAAMAGFTPICIGIAGSAGSTKEITGRLGDEDFQLRGYVVGTALPDVQDRGVRAAATWARNEGGGMVLQLRQAFSRFGLAQAEFYYDGTGPQRGLRSDVLFSTKWRARMRRYRDVDGFSRFRAQCAANGGGGDCAIAGTALTSARQLIIH